MMNEPEKSDFAEVARKPTNGGEGPPPESVERRAEAEGNTNKTRTRRTPSRESVITGLERVRERARQEKKERFTALLHHVNVDLLRAAFSWLKRDAAPGVDGLTWQEYERNLEDRLVDLHARVHRGAYRAQPSRRKFIPKGDGNRPLGVAALEDKIVQRAVVEVLTVIYEEDFLGFSYGFRPGRGQHDALDALAFGITRTKVNYILDCDVRSFFDSVSHEWLVRFLEHRIGDPRVIRLIRKWLKAGVVEDGEWSATEIGTPQGSVISVMLSNLYLHQVLDLWFEQQVKPRLRGEAHLVRYIDDFVICFQFRDDADRVLAVLPKRLKKFALELEPNKTKLVKFGRFAQREARVQEKRPETFSFLGFTHFGTRNRNGKYKVGRKMEKSRLRRSMASLTELMRDIRHWSLQDQVHRLNQVLRGHYAYYGLAGNWRSLHKVYRFVERYWHKMLCSRSWAARFTWEIFHRLRDRFPLQRPTISLTYQEMQACAVLQIDFRRA